MTVLGVFESFEVDVASALSTIVEQNNAMKQEMFIMCQRAITESPQVINSIQLKVPEPGHKVSELSSRKPEIPQPYNSEIPSPVLFIGDSVAEVVDIGALEWTLKQKVRNQDDLEKGSTSQTIFLTRD